MSQSGYVFLGRLLVLFATQLSKLKPERSSQPTGEWARQNGRGERAQISRFPGHLTHVLYVHSKENSMCNGIT